MKFLVQSPCHAFDQFYFLVQGAFFQALILDKRPISRGSILGLKLSMAI